MIIADLTLKVKNRTELKFLVQDARRFVLKFRSVIESTPLQIYSAIAFCPEASIVRFLFKNHVPKWLRRILPADLQWDPFLQTLKPYTGDNVALSPDGKLVVSPTGHIWDTSTGTLVKELEYNSCSVAFSQDGKALMSATWDGKVKTWDITTGHLILELGSGQGASVAVSSKSRNMAAIVGLDYTSITIIDLHGERYATLERADSGEIMALAFSPDGAVLVSASEDGTICFWDTTTADLRRTLKEHCGGESTVTFSPNGSILASAGMDKLINLWNADTGAHLVKIDHRTGISFLAFSPDSSLLASTDRDGILRLWEAATGAFLRKIDGHFTAPIFSPNGEFLTSTGGRKGRSFYVTAGIRLWETKSGRLAKVVADVSYFYDDVSFSPDSNVMVSASEMGIQLWDLTLTANRHSSNTHTKIVRAWRIALNSSSGRAVLIAEYGLATLWDVSTASLLSTIGVIDQLNLRVVLSPDGNLIAASGPRSSIEIIDSGTGKLLRTLTAHAGAISNMVFTSDNRVLASASFGVNHNLELGCVSGDINPDPPDPSICLWDTNTGDLLQKFDGPLELIGSLSFSMDGMILVATYEDGRLHLWNAKTGKLCKALDNKGGKGTYIDVTFSSYGKMVAFKCYGRETSLHVWDMDTGQLVRTLGHLRFLHDAKFSPNGRILATVTYDAGIQLWNPATGELLASCNMARGVDSITFSEDGEYLDTNMGRFSIEMICPSLITPKNQKRDPGIFVRNPWVFRGTEKILLLPPGYYARCASYRDGVLVMGHENGRVSIIRFEQDEIIDSV